MVYLILQCISMSSLSIIWHGEKFHRFTPSRGIRQGDMLSPYLFMLCMEVPNENISSVVIEGEWDGIKLSRRWPVLSHLNFAYVVLLFGELTKNQAKVMEGVLQAFYGMSAQKVNLAKPKLFFSKNIDTTTKDKM